MPSCFIVVWHELYFVTLLCVCCAVFPCFLTVSTCHARLTRWAVETGECMIVVWIVTGSKVSGGATTCAVPNGLTRWIWAIKRIYKPSLTTSYCCRCSQWVDSWGDSILNLLCSPRHRCSLSLLWVQSFSLLLCPRFGLNSCRCICQIELRVFLMPHPVLRSAIHISLSFLYCFFWSSFSTFEGNRNDKRGHLSCGQSIGSSGSTMDWWLKSGVITRTGWSVLVQYL